MTTTLKHGDITDAIFNVFYFVYNKLGLFLERVYRYALMHELRKRGFAVACEVPIRVYYGDIIVGDYYADLIVNGVVLIEIKAVDGIAHEHEKQTINYLKASDIEVALILNFGPKPKAMRKVYDNDLKSLVFE
jgi:GxxExxY protein